MQYEQTCSVALVHICCIFQPALSFQVPGHFMLMLLSTPTYTSFSLGYFLPTATLPYSLRRWLATYKADFHLSPARPSQNFVPHYSKKRLSAINHPSQKLFYLFMHCPSNDSVSCLWSILDIEAQFSQTSSSFSSLLSKETRSWGSHVEHDPAQGTALQGSGLGTLLETKSHGASRSGTAGRRLHSLDQYQ